MKKKWVLFLFFLTVLLFASCGTPSGSSCSFGDSGSSGTFPTTDLGLVVEDVHVHSYKQTVTKNYTCTEPGETTSVCVCGDSYTESLAARHVFVLIRIHRQSIAFIRVRSSGNV